MDSKKTSQVLWFGPTTEGMPPTPATITACLDCCNGLHPQSLRLFPMQRPGWSRSRSRPSSAQKRPWPAPPWGKSQSPSRSPSATRASLPFLQHARCMPASGPLHRLCPLPGSLFPDKHLAHSLTSFRSKIPTTSHPPQFSLPLLSFSPLHISCLTH